MPFIQSVYCIDQTLWWPFILVATVYHTKTCLGSDLHRIKCLQLHLAIRYLIIMARHPLINLVDGRITFKSGIRKILRNVVIIYILDFVCRFCEESLPLDTFRALYHGQIGVFYFLFQYIFLAKLSHKFSINKLLILRSHFIVSFYCSSSESNHEVLILVQIMLSLRLKTIILMLRVIA